MSAGYELINEGDRYYARALRAIRSAQSSVYVMVYIWQNDAIGRLFLSALERKARSGVKVMVVADAVGSYELPRNYFRALERAGASVYMHHRWRVLSWNWFRYLIRRNHRKIIVVDDRIAFTGGFNIMRECSLRHFGDRRWLDLAFVSENRGFVRNLSAQFRDACRRASHRRWAMRLLLRSRNRVIYLNRRRAIAYSMSRWLKRKLRMAQSSIIISVPYFIPYGFFFRILVRKLKRGVPVEIILPESSDVPSVDSVSFFLARKLLRRGATVYLYHGSEKQRRFSHTKFFMIDSFAGTGSANYDYRSMVLNLDTLVFVKKNEEQWQRQYDEMKRFSRVAREGDLKPGFFVRLMLPFRWLL